MLVNLLWCSVVLTFHVDIQRTLGVGSILLRDPKCSVTYTGLVIIAVDKFANVDYEK